MNFCTWVRIQFSAKSLTCGAIVFNFYAHSVCVFCALSAGSAFVECIVSIVSIIGSGPAPGTLPPSSCRVGTHRHTY